MGFKMLDSQYLAITCGAALAYVLTTILYRLFFHPLKHIPGPLMARTSSWHECWYDIFVGGKHPWQLKAMHEKYGPIVSLPEPLSKIRTDLARPVPNEVHFSDPDFLDTIYATKNRNSPLTGGLMIEQSVGAAEDFNLHRLRRHAMEPYFSPKALLTYEHLLTAKQGKLRAIFDRALKSKEPLNLSDALFAFANDFVRVFSFGSDNNLLEDLNQAKFQRESLAKLLLGVQLNKHFPWIQRSLATVVTAVFGAKGLPPAVLNMIQWRAQARKDIEAVLANKTDKPPDTPSIFYELRDSTILPPEEKTVRRLQDEATLLLMAGTESPAKSMTIAAFYAISQPEIMTRMRQELSEQRQKDNLDTLSLKHLLTLPYINAVLTEANRLSFGVTRRPIRYSPNETLTYTAKSGPYKGTTYTLPPGTRMSSATLCTNTDEDVFPDPWTFNPDRWLSKAESDRGSSVEDVNRRKKCMMSLGKGHRVCVGRNVQQAEICLMLQVLADYDLRLFETDESDVKFQYDYQVSHPRLDSVGVRAVVEKKDSKE